MCALTALALTLAVICPESPRWLLLKGLKKEAVLSLNFIANFNDVKTSFSDNVVFEEEPQTVIHLENSFIGKPLSI